jgi:hypothetical protein
VYHLPMPRIGKLPDIGRIEPTHHGGWEGARLVLRCPSCERQHIFLVHHARTSLVNGLGYVVQALTPFRAPILSLDAGLRAPCGLVFTIRDGELVGFEFEPLWP